MTESQPADKSLRVLVTGATGYIGGRLAPRLVDAGHRVRAMARNPDKISDVPWAVDVDVVCADLTDQDSLDDACRNIDGLRPRGGVKGFGRRFPRRPAKSEEGAYVRVEEGIARRAAARGDR